MIDRSGDVAGTGGRRTALACIEAGIQAALPDRVVGARVALDGSTLRLGTETVDLDDFDEVVVLGGGKAAGGVAAALESVLGDAIDGGLVVASEATATDRIEVAVGDHPLPTERNVAATRRVLDRAGRADRGTLVIAVITGGGSALLAHPAGDIPLSALRAVTDALLRAGAPIDDINTVRACLSDVKAGGLGRVAAPATVIGLIFSDVVGDDPGLVASGPTVPRPKRPGEALEILDRFDVEVPEPVATRLDRLATVDRDHADPEVRNVIIANAMTAIEAARDEARRRGYTPCILSSRVQGESSHVAPVHRAIAIECLASGNPVSPPAVVLSGGETTVTVRGEGTGGPNLEFAVASAVDLPVGVTIASVDTDGHDGATEAAGGIVDHETVEDPDAARRALDDNDTYPYLAARRGIVRTGITGTNVNDLRLAVIEAT